MLIMIQIVKQFHLHSKGRHLQTKQQGFSKYEVSLSRLLLATHDRAKLSLTTI